MSKASDVNVTNRKGESALHLAAINGLTELTEALLTAGANPNLQTIFEDRQTPLHFAIKGRHKGVIQALIDALDHHEGGTRIKPNLNIKNHDGLTPLALALAEELNDIATDLLNGNFTKYIFSPKITLYTPFFFQAALVSMWPIQMAWHCFIPL